MMEEDTPTTLMVDGSHGEGGGQIIRNAVTYACVLRRHMKVINIRANRPNPGLASQHLESIKAMMRISGATSTVVPRKNDKEFDMNGRVVPAVMDGVSTTIDLVTAGSVTLCIQCILPFLLKLRSPSNIRVIGGTHVMKSPSFDYLNCVFLPILNKFLGYHVKADLRNAGYFPRGGGCVNLYVNPTHTSSEFKTFELMQRGNLLRTNVILNITHQMKHKMDKFKQQIICDTRNIECRIVSYASVEYLLEFESSYAGFSHLVEGRNPRPDQVFEAISKVQSEMKSFLDSSAVLDQWMQDQLIIYMTLAKCANPTKTSSIRTVALTDHTRSALHVSTIFVPDNHHATFNNDDNTVTISM